MATRRKKEPEPEETTLLAVDPLDEALDAIKGLKILGRRVELTTPTDIADRTSVLVFEQDLGTRIYARAAALGLCWPWLGRRISNSGNLLAFGKTVVRGVLTEARERGEDPEAVHVDLMSAGYAAMALCRKGLAPVEGVANFSNGADGQDGKSAGSE